MDSNSTKSGGSPSAWTAPVRRVLVLGDGKKDTVQRALAPMVAWLEARGIHVTVELDIGAFSGRHSQPNGSTPPAVDLVVVLGGDGSVLTAVRAYGADPIPVLGVHFGRVGFLAPVLGMHWKEGLSEALEGRCLVEQRMRLEVILPNGERHVGLNDAVVARPAASAIVGLKLFVDGQVATEYNADGLIMATASGSTAYSLAAGGPIMAPELQGLVVTPISAHALAHRPLLLGPKSLVTTEVLRCKTDVAVVVDGQEVAHLEQGEQVDVRRCKVDYPLLVPSQLDPWRRLADRLGWRGSLA